MVGMPSSLRALAASAKKYFRPERPHRPLEQRLDAERRRIEMRRAALGVADEPAERYGLALSGGGIRSATFALGVLQGLARARGPQDDTARGFPAEAAALPDSALPDAARHEAAAPDTRTSAAPTSDATASPAAASDGAAHGAAQRTAPLPAPEHSLLARFDYLSTVSGGGYIGAFFVSLFVPGRLRDGTTPEDAAFDAYRVLQSDPPGRIRSSEGYGPEARLHAALAWLRENGRYLTPVGAGDLIYAIALAVRNWFSVQYVLGTFIATAFALVLAGRFRLAAAWPAYSHLERSLLGHAVCVEPCSNVWWSPFFAAPVAILALALAPLTVAFWLTHPRRREDETAPARVLTGAAIADLAIAAGALTIGYLARTIDAPLPHRLVPTIGGALALLGFGYHAIASTQAADVAAHRVVMTRWTATALQLAIALTVVAVIDTLAQSLYLAWARQPSLGAVLSPSASVAAAVWLFRRIARLADRGAVPSLKAIPVGLIAGVAGTALFLAIATLWGFALHAVIWLGAVPTQAAFEIDGALQQATLLAICAGAFALLAITSGRFTGFLNLSTLQSFYSARLTRAYLGASNGARFKPDSSGADRAARSAAEPVDGDDVARDEYYASLAPLHIINVTVNQTIDPAEQLVQRDRKGKPMAVLPTGFSIDRTHYDFHDDERRGVGAGLGSQKLTIGQWIGTSGAAFTTGLGRSTSLGTSIALGLANVRLGTWWSSGYGRDESRWLERGFKGLFKTQTFLFYELMAKFHGLRREWQYLSDGGHFENTGLYELLRPARGVKLIVVCDDGCDPDYRFSDLANVVRLARIDHGVQIEVDEEIADTARQPRLGKVFGTPAEFRAADAAARAPHDGKCALLLNVYRADADPKAVPPTCRIIVLKPRVIASAPVDVREYSATHPAFPQEPTTDQFFDEAQWESYRSLGLAIAERVFGHGADRENGDALWAYLEGAPPRSAPHT